MMTDRQNSNGRNTDSRQIGRASHRRSYTSAQAADKLVEKVAHMGCGDPYLAALTGRPVRSSRVSASRSSSRQASNDSEKRRQAFRR